MAHSLFKPCRLHLVSSKGWVKRLWLLYKRLIQPYLTFLAIPDDAFRHFPPVQCKLKRCLASKEGRVKHLLLFYAQIIQYYLNLL